MRLSSFLDPVRRYFQTSSSAAGRSGRKARSSVRLGVNLLEKRELLSGFWQALTNKPTFASGDQGVGTMTLLPNGSIMVNGEGSFGSKLVPLSGASKNWYELTPDSTGSYVRGTWTQLPSMNTPRRFFGSAVLPDGEVLIVGGEYDNTSANATDINTGEIYNLDTNKWRTIASVPTPDSTFGDGMLEVLPNGHVLAGYLKGSQTYIYDPSANSWTTGPSLLNSDSSGEEGWVKMADGSLLSYEIQGSQPQTGQRFIPGATDADGQWVATGSVPVALESTGGGSNGAELGPGVLLPNSQVFWIGASGATALYAPPNRYRFTGKWIQGPNIVDNQGNTLGGFDTPAAMMVNGKVLFAAGPIDGINYSGPTTIFEYDPTVGSTGKITQVTAAGPPLTEQPFESRMLTLPTGEVLFCDSSNQLYTYTPDGKPDPAWAPAITNLRNHTFAHVVFTELDGTQLTGMSEGAGYGDDAQMASNYPIIWYTTPTGRVYTAETYDWSNNGVQTGTTPESTQLFTPVGPGAYIVYAIANGIRSAGALDIITGGGINNITLQIDPNKPQYYEVLNNGLYLTEFYTGSFNKIIVTEDNSDTAVDIENTLPGVPVIVNEGDGNDSVYVADGATTLGGIKGDITVNPGRGTDRLWLFDQGDSADVGWTVAADHIARSGSANIFYSGQSQVSIYGGPGSGYGKVYYNVSSIEPGSTQTNLWTRGTSVVYVGAADSIVHGGGSTLNVYNVSGINTLTVDDSGAPNPVTVSQDTFTSPLNGLPWGLITGFDAKIAYDYRTTSQLTMYMGTGAGNVVNLHATGVPTIVSAAGSTAVNIGQGGFVQNILGSVSVVGSGASLVVDDSQDTNARRVVLDNGSLAGLTPAALNWISNDSYTSVTSLVIKGGLGNNILLGPAAGGTWNISGPNSGSLGIAAFTGFPNLIGGPGPDVFAFSIAGKVSTVNGGRGANWLDYSAFPAASPVSVNLAPGSATNVGGGVAGAVFNIQNVWGGAGNDSLTGNALGNVLVGGVGNDALTAGTGRSVLVGGLGSDQVIGNSSDDIIIGGTLRADLGETALSLSLQEWQRADLAFDQRVADLRHGGGLNGGYQLTWGITVLDDGGAPDTLTGGGGQNWFFQFPGDTITDLAAGDIVDKQPLAGASFVSAMSLAGAGWDDAYSVATDPQGNVYVVGDFQGTVDFDPGPGVVDLTAAGAAGSNGWDTYLAKYSPTGALLWVRQFGENATSWTVGDWLTVDAAGNASVVGYLYGGSAVFGPITLPGTTGAAGATGFAAKVDAAGNVLWAEQLGGTSANTNTYCDAITADAAGNLYITGEYTGTTTVGSFALTSAGSYDGFVAKLDGSGNVLWAKSVGGAGYDYAAGLAVDRAGNIYVGGDFSGTAQFGSASLTSAGGVDLFALKLSKTGSVVWARDLGGTADDWGAAVAVDPAGNMYLGGTMGGNASDYGQAYLAKLNSSGVVQWTKMYGTGPNDGIFNLAVDGSGNLYAVGGFVGTISFDRFNFTSAGGWDTFVVKLNSSGAAQWAQAFGGTGDEWGAGIAVDPSSNVYAVGSFQNTVDFDADPQGTDNLTSGGTYNGFMVELTQPGALSFTAPATVGAASYTLQLSQGYLQVVDNTTGLVVAQKSVAETTAVQISAANGVDTALFLDYGTDSAAVPVTFMGGSGTNTLVGPASGAAWTITGANAGKVGSVSFSNVANLVGGDGDDSFKLSAKGSLSGLITGGGGSDTLDYSAWTTGVTVNLTTGSATAVAGGVSGIDSIFGGSGNDSLTGGGQGGLLVGGSGNDTISAGAGRSILIGDGGSDTLIGGFQEDLLIAGTTSFDNNHAALLQILREWQRTDETSSQRIADLKSGGGYNGTYKLVWGSTVKDDSATDTLTGGTGLDWFFAQQSAGLVDDMITDLNNGGTEQVN